MRALVVTTVHHPDDSRIRARQIAAMLAAGWDVTYASPYLGYGLPLPAVRGLRPIDLPRSHGRHRARAVLAARRTLRTEGPSHDVVLLHDPELLFAARGLGLAPVVWDMHEDTTASLGLKPWLPHWLHAVAASAIRRLERWAEDNVTILLAEPTYQERFARPHVVVPNGVRVPASVSPPGDRTVVYIGGLTEARGARELVALGRALSAQTGGHVRLHLVGAAEPAMEPLVREARDEGSLTWDGYLPSAQALATLDGALAGLSLLRDRPNYRISMPTKVLEYMAYGVPVVSTPLPLVERLLAEHDTGIVVPFGDVPAATKAVLRLAEDADERARMADAGRAAVAEYDWAVRGPAFLAELERVAAGGAERRL